MQYLRPWLYTTSLLISAACGGGGGGSSAAPVETPPTLLTGRFIDAPVSGLTFRSGATSGLTDETGAFTYEQGEPISLQLGALTLGSAAGAEVLTPLDLVTDGTLDDNTVLNIARLLLLTDTDADATNGISIPAEVRTLAEDWPAIDLNDDLDLALAPLLPELEMALGRVPEVPTAAAARAHLQDSLACLSSGVYQGTFSGDDEGTFLFWVQAQRYDPATFGDFEPRVGVTSAIAYSTAEDVVIGVAPSEGLAFDQAGAVVAGTTSSDAVFRGSLADFATLNGTWTNQVFDETGTFSGARLAGDLDAQYRLAGFFSLTSVFSPDTTGVVALDVFSDDQVDGALVTLRGEAQVALTGSLRDGSIEVTGGGLSLVLAFDADGSDPANDAELGPTAGFLGTVSGGALDGAGVIGTSCRL